MVIRVGMAGAGFSAAIHVEALQRVHGVEVCVDAVAGSSSESAAAFAKEHHIPTAYGSWQELVADPSIDVICVCLPNALHEPVILEATASGKHIICEKPLTGAFGTSALINVERARDEHARAAESIARIRSAVERAGVQFMYAENWVFAPAMTKTKRLIELTGGSILDIRAEESHSGSHALRSRRRESAGGGALMVLGSHPLAAALHLKGHESQVHGRASARVTSVTAETAAFYDSEAVRNAPKHDWIVSDWADVETWASLILGFSDGSRAVINASFAMLGGVRNELEVYTTNAAYRIAMTPSQDLLAFTPDELAFGTEYLHEKLESRTGWISAAPDEDWARGYPQEMQHFMESIAAQTPPISDLALASDVVDITYLGYLSAAEGRRVEV